MVAHHLQVVAGAELSKPKVPKLALKWSVKGLPKGSYQVIGSIVVSTTVPGSDAAATVSRATGAKLVVS